ncbi:MAG: pyruvate kinase [Spirochaetaceae bacterium]|jgi:pyruvate kinase|nr:pyruvate kinase [Spirochaetaceae bacterium]
MNKRYFRRTKIVCTVGPACDSDDVLRKMFYAGMNVARFNFSHGEYADHKVRIDRVRRISAEMDLPVALMLDTKGPEIRTGLVEGNGIVEFRKGDTVMVSADRAWTVAADAHTPGHISLSWKDIGSRAAPGVRILIADGLFELDVLESDGKTVTCRAANNAKIGSRKNVNLIGIHPGLPIIGEQDKKDLAFGAEQGLDFIAASFLCFPHEVTEIREYIRTLRWPARIIAKIESQEGLDNINRIAELADGVMVARGDLAVQIPDDQIPLAQKKIISAARRHCKPVITATQMLDSMIVNPRPTRAELTDVANAIFDGSDAVMLSGETASGAYPAEAVAMMSKIACTIEQSAEYREHIRNTPIEFPAGAHSNEVARVTSRSTYEIAHAVDAKVILIPTTSGNSVRQIAMWRPEQPILGVTPDEAAARSMQLDWGVIPKLTKTALHSDEMILNALKILAETTLADISDKVVLAAGLPLHSPLPLNTIRILIMGNVLARSSSGGHASGNTTRANGKIVWAATAPEARQVIKANGGDILVCPILTDEYIPILRIVRGVICEGNCHIVNTVLSMVNPNLVWLTGVRNATRKLESGLNVTIDGDALLVYEGMISS